MMIFLNLNKKMLRFVTALMLICALPLHASTDRKRLHQHDTRDKLIQSLGFAKSATDSIMLLYNIYDLSSESQADSVATRLYELAKTNKFDDVAIDILRDMAQMHLDDNELLKKIQRTLEHDFPPSDLQKETLIYVKLYRAYIEMGQTPEKEMREKIVKIINHYGAEYSSDPYERLMQLFLQCTFIGHETQGGLLTQYLDQLESQLKSIPHQSEKLTARLYRQKAYSYTVNADSKRAVEADRKLLDIYDKIERINAKQGRPYRSLDRFRHNSFCRMLTNYPALTINEVDSIYNRILEIEANNPNLSDYEHVVPGYKVFRMLAHGDYASAIEPLRTIIATEKDHINRRLLLKQLIIASQAAGRKDVQLEAATEYVNSMREYLDSKLGEIIRELQIIYDVDHLQSDSAKTELKIQQQIGERHNIIIMIVIMISIVLVMILIVFILLYRRYNKLSHSLFTVNEKLHAKHNEMLMRTNELREAIDEATKAEQQKASFIKYISSTILLPLRSMMNYADRIIKSAKNDEKPFLQRFAGIIRENSESLSRIASRLQKLSKESE